MVRKRTLKLDFYISNKICFNKRLTIHLSRRAQNLPPLYSGAVLGLESLSDVSACADMNFRLTIGTVISPVPGRVAPKPASSRGTKVGSPIF